jgi:nicotinate-nucleotide pyrophosphorylase (carboxylating)
MNRLLWEPIVRAALLEDLGRAGDVTTDAIVPADRIATAYVVARADGVIAGLEPSLAAFTIYDASVRVEAHVADGACVRRGDRIATVDGPARALLTAERTCLNLLGHLSGIATATRGVVDATTPHGAAIVDTRKTTPGLRALEKAAVRAGGGANHRFGLDDAVLIKDNHVAVAGGITAAVHAARANAGHLVKVEVEVDSLDQLDEALGLPVDVVLLDNFTADGLRDAVRRVRASGRPVLTEASGGIRPDDVAAVAAAGVDLISMGWLTHSAPNLDVALDL